MKQSFVPSTQQFSYSRMKLKIKIGVFSSALYTTLWCGDILATAIFTYLIMITIIGLISLYLEKSYESLSQALRGLLIGTFSGLMITLLPKYHIIGVFCDSILLHFGVRDIKVKKMPLVVLSNLGSWILCFLTYNHSQDVETKPSIFTDSNLAAQLFVSFIIKYCLIVATIFDRKIEIEVREKYESRLFSLNKELGATNEKLQTTNKQLQEALEEKENFVLRFSHEIRNPLNSLLGNIELCYECAQGSESKTMLKEAKISGEILLQLLNNVLDTAKVSTGKLDTSVHSQSIREFLERAWVVTSEIIRKKGLFGCLSINVDVPEILDFDSHRVMQVLINTVSNATKFTEHGFVKVFVDFEEGTDIRPEDMKPRHTSLYHLASEEKVKAINDDLLMEDISEYPKDKYDCLTVIKKKFTIDREKYFRHQTCFTNPISAEKELNIEYKKRNDPRNHAAAMPKNGFLRFEITDSGCGIKKADLDSLFTKFKQVNQETAKRQIGTGLGLWITKEIIELMEGKIEIFSIPNHGTTLVIMLKSRSSRPLATAETVLEAVMSPERKASSPRSCSRGKRVLVVEDIPYNQEINRRFLEKCEEVGEIIVANNGKEALDLFRLKREGYFDLILMDVDMPVMDGKEATKLIRLHEQSRRWSPIPIVFLTAYSEPRIQKELLDSEGPYKANRFLSKPVSQEIIKRNLSQLFARKSSGTQASNESKSITSLHMIKKEEEEKKIALIVDDDSFNLAMMSRMIKICGYESLQAQNGAAAVQLYEKHWREISVIFMDCEMPIMDGWEAAEAILQHQEKQSLVGGITKAPPIYGLTGHVGGEYKQKCIKVGMKDILEKPITIDRLRKLFCDEAI